MRLIDADALKEQLFKLATLYPGCGEAIADAAALVCHAPTIEGEEPDEIDYDWLEQEYRWR